MKYFASTVDGVTEEVSADKARFILEGRYRKDCVDDLFDNEKSFRLQGLLRTVWTETEDHLSPIPGFFGVCE